MALFFCLYLGKILPHGGIDDKAQRLNNLLKSEISNLD